MAEPITLRLVVRRLGEREPRQHTFRADGPLAVFAGTLDGLSAGVGWGTTAQLQVNYDNAPWAHVMDFVVPRDAAGLARLADEMEEGGWAQTAWDRASRIARTFGRGKAAQEAQDATPPAADEDVPL